MDQDKVLEKLESLGLKLPRVAPAVATYVPAVRTGSLLFISGQGPIEDGKYKYVGKVGGELTLEQGYDAAKHVMLNCLAVIKNELGSLDKVKRIVKLLAWVNSAPGFNRQPMVINGGSDLLVELFGERGRHARSAVAANELPFDIPVEIEMIVECE
ncbi:RidA family protein [Cohnella candidum]|uniref:RidA family protein n=1 Tax=Cohnella candidum TaxID=2674991 RepID=A0A3G3K339_9BACL|nr:RidA family protein [Cohnella candidum]AYQ74916.1 RidA family protein [Cohnella candidum]